jgi:hypothetical protein
LLISIDTGKTIDWIPHQEDFARWTSRLSEAEIRAIRSELDAKINVDRILTSSWLPGADWSETVFQPIYEKACQFNEVAAGWCFGLFLWEAIMRDKNKWGFGRYPKDGQDIIGMTYFTLGN